jgi:hypothetical protein
MVRAHPPPPSSPKFLEVPGCAQDFACELSTIFQFRFWGRQSLRRLRSAACVPFCSLNKTPPQFRHPILMKEKHDELRAARPSLSTRSCRGWFRNRQGCCDRPKGSGSARRFQGADHVWREEGRAQGRERGDPLLASARHCRARRAMSRERFTKPSIGSRLSRFRWSLTMSHRSTWDS